jgi:hypothetical protein
MAASPEIAFDEFTLGGVVTFRQAQRLLTEAIARARAAGRSSLLADLREVEGFTAPSLVERHRMVREWAQAAEGRVRLALVVRPEFIHSERFGVVAARNFGLQGDVFTSADEARAWLLRAGA